MNKAGETVASVDVPVDRYIYFATEDAGVDVPIVNKQRMCRNGCCTTCAVKVLEGKVGVSSCHTCITGIKVARVCCVLWVTRCRKPSFPGALVLQLVQQQRGLPAVVVFY